MIRIQNLVLGSIAVANILDCRLYSLRIMIVPDNMNLLESTESDPLDKEERGQYDLRKPPTGL